MELKEVGLANVKAVPRTSDIWIGINKLREILPRFSFRVPECERGLQALCAYHTVRDTLTGHSARRTLPRCELARMRRTSSVLAEV